MLQFILILTFINVEPQSPKSAWDILSTVEIEKGYDSFMGNEIDKPVFSNQLEELERQQIMLEGFMIPLNQDENQDYFVLSRFPYQSCFFCGGAGPETVVEVFTETDFSFSEEKIRVEGQLVLNSDNPLQLFFVLKNAKVLTLN